MRLEPSPRVKRVKAKSQRSAENRGFSPGYFGFLPQGKLTGWVRYVKGPTVIGTCCCGDPALISKAKYKKYTLN